jgi:FkbM family methyltransferase
MSAGAGRGRIPKPIRTRLRPLIALRRRLRSAPEDRPGARVDGGGADDSRDAAHETVTLPSGGAGGVVAKNQHGSYCVPRSARHRPAARAILASRVWEPDTLDLLRGADPDGDVIHAGTFFGDFIPALANSRAHGAVVWAFEPNRESYECARVTITLNGLENVILNHAGLHGKSATGRLATSDSTGRPLGGGSHLIETAEDANGASSEAVSLLAIDDVISSDRRVSLIQLDVEGHELEALAGAMATIERCRPLIVVETPPHDWIAERLVPLGYRVAQAVDANTVVRHG